MTLQNEIENLLGRFITQKPKEVDGILEIDVRAYAQELLTLIQDREKEAVEGFRKWYNDFNKRYPDFADNLHIEKEEIKEYLQTLKEGK